LIFPLADPQKPAPVDRPYETHRIPPVALADDRRQPEDGQPDLFPLTDLRRPFFGFELRFRIKTFRLTGEGFIDRRVRMPAVNRHRTRQNQMPDTFLGCQPADICRSRNIDPPEIFPNDSAELMRQTGGVDQNIRFF